MFGRPLCTAAFVFALAVFITLQVFPPQLDPYPELDREEAVLSGTIDSIEYKQDYKQSYARRGAQDGQQKQSRQITAIRSFIQQDVDYIVLAPVTQTGWDSVLSEARKAEIPVIIVDRMVAVDDPELFTCWVGSDFLTEGRKACEWLHEFTEANEISPEDIHIVNIQGTLDSSAQLGRTRGLEEAARAYGWDLREQAPGDFTQAKGREVMARMLKTYNNINVVYCENDNEALGAIEAIEAAGQKCGSDIMNGEIMVISFDGVNENAIQYCLDGTISLIVECNPLHGPRVEAILQSLEKGETPEKYEYVYETLYSSCRDVESVTVEEETYSVTILTQEVIDARPKKKKKNK